MELLSCAFRSVFLNFRSEDQRRPPPNFYRIGLETFTGTACSEILSGRQPCKNGRLWNVVLLLHFDTAGSLRVFYCKFLPVWKTSTTKAFPFLKLLQKVISRIEKSVSMKEKQPYWLSLTSKILILYTSSIILMYLPSNVICSHVIGMFPFPFFNTELVFGLCR